MGACTSWNTQRTSFSTELRRKATIQNSGRKRKTRKTQQRTARRLKRRKKLRKRKRKKKPKRMKRKRRKTWRMTMKTIQTTKRKKRRKRQESRTPRQGREKGQGHLRQERQSDSRSGLRKEGKESQMMQHFCCPLVTLLNK